MKFVAISFLLFLVVSCNTDQRTEYIAVVESNNYSYGRIFQEHPGKLLMENNCYACHSPKASEDNMAAPPMIAVKMHYISEDTSKEDFVNNMVNWCKNPSKETSKMPAAVKKFGLMPYQFYPESTIRQIAEYMFDTEIEEPDWFQEHYKKMQDKSENIKTKKG